MNSIKNILFYPIKLILKRRVKKWRLLLKKEKERQSTLMPKQRRSGMTWRVNKAIMNNIKLIMRYQRLINKWKV